MRGHDQDVSRLAHFDGGMEHQVIAWMAKHGHGRAADPRRRINRPHVGQHQAGAALRFVNSGCAELPKYFRIHIRVRPFDVADDSWLHEKLLRSL